MATVASADLLRARFAAQRLSGNARLGADPATVARAVCGVQAQELNAGLLSLRARSVGLTRDRALAGLEHDRTLAWTWLMRGTLHICAADDLRWLLSLFGPLNAARDARRRAQVGLDDAACTRGLRVMREVLSGGPMTRHELREALLTRDVDVTRDPQAHIHLLAYAAARGVIVVLAPVGRGNRFALLDDWIPATRAVSREYAEAQLARRYFAAFGPATVSDFKTWAGVPVEIARRATTMISRELESIAGPVPDLLRSKHAASAISGERPTQTVRLLPRWDTYMLGYRSRDLVLDPAHTPLVCVSGVIKPTVCVDGVIDGSWELRRERSTWQLDITPFHPPGRVTARGVLAERDAIAEFLGAAVRGGDAGVIGAERFVATATRQ
jgi:hypothetical protein